MSCVVVVVLVVDDVVGNGVGVYHVTIVAIEHGLLKKFFPMVIGCVLRTARSLII